MAVSGSGVCLGHWQESKAERQFYTISQSAIVSGSLASVIPEPVYYRREGYSDEYLVCVFPCPRQETFEWIVHSRGSSGRDEMPKDDIVGDCG